MGSKLDPILDVIGQMNVLTKPPQQDQEQILVLITLSNSLYIAFYNTTKNHKFKPFTRIW